MVLDSVLVNIFLTFILFVSRIKCCVMLRGCNLVSGDINIHLVVLGVWLKKMLLLYL